MEIKNVLPVRCNFLMRGYSVLAVGGELEIIQGIKEKRNMMGLGIDG